MRKRQRSWSSERMQRKEEEYKKERNKIQRRRQEQTEWTIYKGYHKEMKRDI